MKKTLSITILLAMLCALLSGCGAQSEPEGEGISVVATVFAPYDFARQLVGERGEVTLLLPPGSEAHSYEPSRRTLSRYRTATSSFTSAECRTHGCPTCWSPWAGKCAP